MKKLIFLFCCFLIFACQEHNKKKVPQTSEKPTEESTGKTSNLPENLCFLSIVGSSKVDGKTVQDSLVLNLKIRNNKVSGVYNWIPAEKDVRRGTIVGEKQENSIRGEYLFMQEGKKQAQSIFINLHDDYAKVTTNAGKQGEMVVEIEKVDCKKMN
ncbi:MAG TPA: hypothetical protein VFM65_03170 [Flavobacteriaceae bacterium]|nr:hypothetical protein [Flavobacteriaceae bacterium]